VNKHVDDKFLWHNRLGHPSKPVIQCIQKPFPYVKCENSFVCDACHFSKQSKLSFPNMNNRSSSLFELVHMDIWNFVAYVQN
jgi:hypothetical protein